MFIILLRNTVNGFDHNKCVSLSNQKGRTNIPLLIYTLMNRFFYQKHRFLSANYNYFHNILRDILMFYQIFFLPQVKQDTIITYEYGLCELPHELLNDLRLRILGNWELSGKFLNLI